MPRLRELWMPHAHRRLVEPFCGGLAVTLGLAPRRALLNDVNPHLVNFYRWARRGLTIELPLENSAEAYYACRDRFNALVAEAGRGGREAASLFYYLNRTGYNGLCRFNSRGEFNVPFGRYARLDYRRDFSAFRAVFRNWSFRVGRFRGRAASAGRLRLRRSAYDVPFTRYAREAFGWEDQVRAGRVAGGASGPRRAHQPGDRRGFAASTPAWATTSPSWRRRAGSAAPAIGRPRPRCWRFEMCYRNRLFTAEPCARRAWRANLST